MDLLPCCAKGGLVMIDEKRIIAKLERRIDDFVEACDNQFVAMYGQRYIDMRNIKEIAEQLKGGISND